MSGSTSRNSARRSIRTARPSGGMGNLALATMALVLAAGVDILDAAPVTRDPTVPAVVQRASFEAAESARSSRSGGGISSATGTPYESDFSFGSGSPFTGTTTLGGVSVTLTSLVTEPFGSTAFRDTESAEDATVTFTFDRKVKGFSFDVQYVNQGESLFAFSLGDPTSLTGDLVSGEGDVTTNRTDDGGAGSLIWTGIDTTTISFKIHTGSGAALAVTRFSITVPVDSDADGVPDDTDADDDNDGITDNAECYPAGGDGLLTYLDNGSFEEPPVAPGAIAFFHEDLVPGWSTTASDNIMEFWGTGFNGVPAAEGNAFVELNANQVSTLYQDISTVPGSTLNWRFNHRGRAGVDVIALKIGAPGATVKQGEYATGNTAWALYSGTYIVPQGQTTTRFEYESVSSTGGSSVGNFLDGAGFSAECKQDTDEDGILDSLDPDSDNDGAPDSVEAGHDQDPDGDGVVDGPYGQNGLADSVEVGTDTGAMDYELTDSDDDGAPDFQDVPVCGDGIREPAEACDDGDLGDGDGCSAECEVESGWACDDASFRIAFTEELPQADTAPPADWEVSEDGFTVTQSVNSGPSVAMTQLPAEVATLAFQITIGTANDDDFIGWVVGFQSGDGTNENADWLLFDWKQGTQDGGGEYGTAQAGLALSHVSGPVDDFELWSHHGDVQEIARATTLGASGWEDFGEYYISMEYAADRIRVYVNETLELDVEGEFGPGFLGFYNYSQEAVTYTLSSPRSISACYGLDSDEDGTPDFDDECPGFDDRQDSDDDGVPDGCDTCVGDDASGDPDEDGLCSDVEILLGSDPDDSDYDDDGVSDVVDEDDDNDGISDVVECRSDALSMVNGSFEEPFVSGGAVGYATEDQVPGWDTTASDNVMEFWYDGFEGVPSASGVQFVELNANEPSTLYQDVPTTPGAVYLYRFYHHGRGGDDTLAFYVGDGETRVKQVEVTTGVEAWRLVTGVYTVPEGQTLSRFSFESVHTFYGGGAGNLLDGISFTPACVTDSDDDGTIDAHDLDSDDDGLTDAEESGHGEEATDGQLSGPFGDNGLADAVETLPDSGSLGYTVLDTDDDGDEDFRDVDSDNDGDGDDVDNCRLTANSDQLDTDDDGLGDLCDDDDDDDGIPDEVDGCPSDADAGQLDTDDDGLGDVCDDDDDNDTVLDDDDNCPLIPNLDQADLDDDGDGDICDDDDDDDTVSDEDDNCPVDPNRDQDDTDDDGDGDACDDDDDDDTIVDTDDNCPLNPNVDQADLDEDDVGDVCDDSDEDGIVDAEDNCPGAANEDQADFDEDGVGDACDDADGDTVTDDVDNCVADANTDQADNDEDGSGDVCDDDDDNDDVPDASDNCPVDANADQADADGDNIGAACDDDDAAEESPTPDIEVGGGGCSCDGSQSPAHAPVGSAAVALLALAALVGRRRSPRR